MRKLVKIEKFDAGSPTAGPYSPCIKAGNMIYVSGQIGLGEDITEQTTAALEGLKKLVGAAGATVGNIVKTTVYLKNIKDFSKMNRAYKKFFKANSVENYPARTTVEASNLPVETMLIEIDCIAVL